jgi:hypothetical protein
MKCTHFFFGGIAQYFDDNGTLTRDNNVPFVNTIARVTRKSDGSMAEFKLPVTLPGLLGAGSEYIPLETIPVFSNGVLKLDEISNDTTLIGYIYGGISSSAPNLFFTNTGTQSNASSQIFKVSLIKNKTTKTHDLNSQSIGTFQMQIFPNPNPGAFEIYFNIKKIAPVHLTISDISGKVLVNQEIKDIRLGKNTYKQSIEHTNKIILVTLTNGTEKATQKVILE